MSIFKRLADWICGLVWKQESISPEVAFERWKGLIMSGSNCVTGVYVGGSRSKGTSTENSDLDIIVEFAVQNYSPETEELGVLTSAAPKLVIDLIKGKSIQDRVFDFEDGKVKFQQIRIHRDKDKHLPKVDILVVVEGLKPHVLPLLPFATYAHRRGLDVERLTNKMIHDALASSTVALGAVKQAKNRRATKSEIKGLLLELCAIAQVQNGASISSDGLTTFARDENTQVFWDDPAQEFHAFWAHLPTVKHAGSSMNVVAFIWRNVRGPIVINPCDPFENVARSKAADRFYNMLDLRNTFANDWLASMKPAIVDVDQNRTEHVDVHLTHPAGFTPKALPADATRLEQLVNELKKGNLRATGGTAECDYSKRVSASSFSGVFGEVNGRNIATDESAQLIVLLALCEHYFFMTKPSEREDSIKPILEACFDFAEERRTLSAAHFLCTEQSNFVEIMLNDLFGEEEAMGKWPDTMVKIREELSQSQ